MDFIILTNNPYVEVHYKKEAPEKLQNGCEIMYMDTSLEGIMLKVRDYIHKGHKLLSHPLSGSVKPHETPYKSVMISRQAGDCDEESLEIIEASIVCCRKFQTMERQYPEHVYADFQLIDFTLIDGAVLSAETAQI